MLDENTFFDSYTRIFGKAVKIDATGNRFFTEFYRRFLECSDDVAEAFKNTDMAVQENMLKRSLLYGVNFGDNMNYFDALHRIAVSHNKAHYDIKPALYDLWLDCMVATVGEFDPEFSDDVELAWRLAFAKSITYMKFLYDK